MALTYGHHIYANGRENPSAVWLRSLESGRVHATVVFRVTPSSGGSTVDESLCLNYYPNYKCEMLPLNKHVC